MNELQSNLQQPSGPPPMGQRDPVARANERKFWRTFLAGMATCLLIQWAWGHVNRDFLWNVLVSGSREDKDWFVQIGNERFFEGKSNSANMAPGTYPVLTRTMGRTSFGVILVGENYIDMDDKKRALDDPWYIELGEVNEAKIKDHPDYEIYERMIQRKSSNTK